MNLKKTSMKGKGNHQYGLKGRLNASWKTDKRITNNGYLKIYKPEHPLSDRYGRILVELSDIEIKWILGWYRDKKSQSESWCQQLDDLYDKLIDSLNKKNN